MDVNKMQIKLAERAIKNTHGFKRVVSYPVRGRNRYGEYETSRTQEYEADVFAAQEEMKDKFKKIFNILLDEEWLLQAAQSVIANKGANTPGIDGVTKDNLNIPEMVQTIIQEIKTGSYKPSPVKRIFIPKANGNVRPLGIPTIKDRIVQEGMRMILDPIFESYFFNNSCGFRPGKRTMDAVHRIENLANNTSKMYWIIEGDIEGCFDNIPHSKLIGVLKQYIDDKKLINLLKMFLNAGIKSKGKVIYSNCGIPQGGLVSPILANIYLHELDKWWWKEYGCLTESEKTVRRRKDLGNVQLIRYADDFVVMTNGDKEFALNLKKELTMVLKRLGLTLSKEKTALTHISDGFNFLGFNIKRIIVKNINKGMIYTTASEKNVQKFKERISYICGRDTVGSDPVSKIKAMNSVIRGWGEYYKYVNSYKIFNYLTGYSHIRLYKWFKAKHSNMSAKVSVKKFVIKTYLKRGLSKQKWSLYGVPLQPMIDIRRQQYWLRLPKSGNVYLEEERYQLSFKEEIPIKNEENTWNGGSTSQSQYSVARLIRLERVGHKCEKCQETSGLEAHHIIPQKDHGSHCVDNLVILCNTCHRETHKSSRGAIG